MHSQERKDISADKFEVECDLQRGESIQEKMKRMEDANLSLAMDIKTSEQPCRPQQRVPTFQSDAVDVSERKMKYRRVRGRKHLAAHQRHH